MQYILIILAAAGGFVAAWPAAYVWAARYGCYLARQILDRDFKRVEDAQLALEKLHREIQKRNISVD